MGSARAALLAVTATFAAAPAAAQAGASPIAWDSQPGYGYLVNPTDQLGVPGEVAGAAVLPDGGVFTPSLEVTPWMSGGTTAGVYGRRGLPDPVVPLFATGLDAVGGDAAWWAQTVAGVPAAVITLHPGTGKEAGIALKWGGTKKAGGKAPAYRYPRPVTAARPGLYEQPGQRFRKGRCWKVRRSGNALVVERGPSVVAVIQGDLKRSKRKVPGIRRVEECAGRPSAIAAQLRVKVRSADGNMRVIIPLRPLSKQKDAKRITALRRADTAAEAENMIAGWRSRRAGGASIRVPEAAVQRAFDASVTNMLVPRYQLPDGRWVQTVNTLQYHAFWIRDLAVITDALDRIGLNDVASDNLSFLTDWQTPDGTFVSRVGQGDGFGQALWVLGQHVRLTGDTAFAKRWVAAVDRAVNWATNAIATQPTGLLPPSDPKDNEWASGTLTGDQLWGVAGLDAAATLAERAGDTALKARALKARDTLRERTVAAMRATAVNGRIQPTLSGGTATSWGDRWAAWPFPTLDPNDPLVKSSVAANIAEQQEGVAFYGAKYMHSYLGFRDWQTALRYGDQIQPLWGLYATIAHLTATGGGYETSVMPWGNRDVKDNLAPHGWLAAELTTFIRDLIAHEDGTDLVVLSALPSAWIQPGAVTQALRLPTNFGLLDITLTPNDKGAQLAWKLTLRAGQKAPRLRWPMPPWVELDKQSGASRVGNELRMSGTSGNVNVTWTRLPDQGPTWTGTLTALQAGYIARGLTPPG